MRSCVRFSVLALVIGAVMAVSAAAAQGFGFQSTFAGNCNASHEACNKSGGSEAEEIAKAKLEGEPQAGAHPPFGVTDFTLNNKEIPQALPGQFAPEGNIKNLRVDVAPGVATNPEVVPKCSIKNFTGTEIEVAPGVHAFTAPNCPGSEIGKNVVKIVVQLTEGPFKGDFANVELEGTVYNLEQEPGLSSLFGVALNAAPVLKGAPLFFHTLILGHVEWASDYHDYFEIKNISPGLIRSRLTFKGNIGEGLAPFGSGGFLTNPTHCTGAGPQTTTEWHAESYEGENAEGKYKSPIGAENCAAVPFKPSFALSPETTQSDAPDGITTELSVPHDLSPTGIDSSHLKTATVVLPEGMTFNPSAAAELEACKPSQARINSKEPGVACPATSKIGTVQLTVPGLPASEPLEGNLYLGGPENGPITNPPYTMYIDAESARYGLSVRLKGTATGNESTGQVTAQFAENPEQPFSRIILHFKGGALAPIANPLACGTATTNTALVPFSGNATQEPFSSFTVDSNGSGGACPSPIPFSPGQATPLPAGNAGGHTNFQFNLGRPSGTQYISEVKTVLPPGLVGAIPAVKQCEEGPANAGTCSAESELGTVSAVAGAGPSPFTFNGGHVYLTGPYHGAPFGMSIVVPAVAGPFNLGNVVTRATINVEPYTDRVIVTSVLPRVFKGVALRIRALSVSINRQGFLFNPTNCSQFFTESTLTGFTPGSSASPTAELKTPFQVANCNKLGFKPSFKAATAARTSKANGASLETTINYVAGNANLKAVKVQLPKALPSRLTTLQKACLAATFEANPFHCPAGSFVGGARANSPTLPSKLTGPAILVSHANEAFPDLDLVLEANGVRTIVVGNTDIKNGITTTNFAATPDVPVSSVTVNLPIGPHSALAANTNLCANPLIMPTTLTGQNGVVVKQNTRITVRGCGVRIVGHRVIGNTAFLTVQTFEAGRISGKGGSLATVFRRLSRAQKATTLKVPLNGGGRRRSRPFSTRVRVGFVPRAKGKPVSVAFVTVRFR